MIKDLTFVTGNKGKLKQFKDYLRFPIKHAHLNLDEIQSMDLEKIVEHKLIQGYNQVRQPVLVDDASLNIEALNGFPGPFFKWLLDAIGLEGICSLMKNYTNKNISGVVLIGFFDGKKKKIFKGKVKGQVADVPKGDRGIDWDRIFIPKGYNLTRAQMNDEDFKKTGPRKMALEKLAKYLNKYSSIN
ncbi:non-canonical purine NTP pyrophosphatase [Candidatus Daviesbacteria bacterium]|nr:non-canonical purine NTP pyrophosphatase [Candidatus Daviesbacteria bacterium]